MWGPGMYMKMALAPNGARAVKTILWSGRRESNPRHQLGRLGFYQMCIRDSCSGERTAAMMIDPDAPDILRAIADRYLDINCSVMTLSLIHI